MNLLRLVGVPIARSSISPSQAWRTPPEIRAQLARFPSWLEGVELVDDGDIMGDELDDGPEPARDRLRHHCHRESDAHLTLFLGGDNSLTATAMAGLARDEIATWGLLTIDAHHDVRPLEHGRSNGTPVRELIEAGLPGAQVAQVGIQPLANRPAETEWLASRGARVVPLAEVRAVGIEVAVAQSLLHLEAAGATLIYADLDVDACDRAFAPACPASLPGGLHPEEYASAARILGRHRRVYAADLVEVDAAADVAHATTRLAAYIAASLAAGLSERRV